MANLCYSDSPIIESGNGSVKMANGSLLTMMYETGKGTGEYVVATDTSWPTTGYVFNSTMSKCCS